MSHWLDHFSTEYYLEGWIPVTQLITSKEELPTVEKFGGYRPFLSKGETWPLDNNGTSMIFVGQFKDPAHEDDSMLRIFMKDHLNDDDYEISKILKVNKVTVKPELLADNYSDIINDAHAIGKTNKSYPCYLIEQWKQVKELNEAKLIEDLGKDRHAVIEGNTMKDQLLQDSEDFEIDEDSIYEFINDAEYDTRSNTGFKWYGYPTDWQGSEMSKYYMEHGYCFQWDTYENNNFSWMWQDAGLIYINPKSLEVTDSSA